MFARMLEEAEQSSRMRTALVGCSCDAVTGYVMAQTAGGEAEIQALAVSASCRRCGLGRQLIEAALERLSAQAVRMVFLEVRASNEGAQAFYRQLNFSEYGRRPQYYRAPVEDAVLMRKWLNASAGAERQR
jgi:ribosomal-protein-alanine N-acetyltransferase